jgi:hypothetical protein
MQTEGKRMVDRKADGRILRGRQKGRRKEKRGRQ